MPVFDIADAGNQGIDIRKVGYLRVFFFNKFTDIGF